MNWGARIVLSFVVFAILIFTMVFISMKQDINLVSTDYYKQEIAYEDQIQRERNTRSLAVSPEIKFENTSQQVIITFPEELATQVKDGYIHLFRPSDSALDKKYKLELNNKGVQSISVLDNLRGLWKIKLYWEDNAKEYYYEKLLTY